MPILTGTVDDVTGSSIADLPLLRVSVRAPSRRASLSEQARLVTSVPVPVEVSPTGEISVELEPGPAVMLVEGEGLRDVYELGVTADMTLLTEALQEMSPTRSWVESQMVQLRDAAVTAAGAATSAAGEAEADRAHVDSIRDLLDEAAQNNVAPYLTQTALNATYVPQTELPNLATKAELDAKGGGTPATPGVELLAAKQAFSGAGRHTVAVVADSTFNDPTEAPWVWWRRYYPLMPSSVRCEYTDYNGATSAWNATSVSQPGTYIPADSGQVVNDTFSRTVADLVGSSPDEGPVWQGTAARWSADGAVATASGSGNLTTDAGSKDLTVTVTLSLVTAQTGSDQNHRYYIAATNSTGADGIWPYLTINGTGDLLGGMYKTLGGTSTSAGSVNAAELGVAARSDTPQTVTVELSIAIQNVTCKFTGPGGLTKTLTTTITEAQYGALGTWAVLKALNAAPGLRLDSVSINRPATPEQGDRLSVWNGAIGGAKFATYNSAKRAAMFGGKTIDLLILSMGHNNTNQTPDAFTAEVEAWVQEWLTDHPETKAVMWVSQNPQFPPAANPVAHRDRQLAARLLARRKGWDYIPAFEAYAARPDGGASLVKADGIHPTMPTFPATTGDFGSVVTAEVMLDAIADRR